MSLSRWEEDRLIGIHQWGELIDNRKVCDICGATMTLDPDAPDPDSGYGVWTYAAGP